MSTTPVITPINTQLHPSELSVFVHKVLYAHLGIFVLLIALLGIGGCFGLRSYDKALAHAQALQVQFNNAQTQFTISQKQLTDLLAQDAQARAQESAQQTSLEQQIANRNVQAPAPAVQTALQPSATAQEVALGLGASYSDVPSFGAVQATSDGKVSLEPPQAQQIIASRENELRFSFDLQAETQLFTLEQAKSSSLQKDLTSCESTLYKAKTALGDANKTIAAYKKLAVRSRWKRFLGGAEKAALIAVGIELGHKI